MKISRFVFIVTFFVLGTAACFQQPTQATLPSVHSTQVETVPPTAISPAPSAPSTETQAPTATLPASSTPTPTITSTPSSTPNQEPSRLSILPSPTPWLDADCSVTTTQEDVPLFRAPANLAYLTLPDAMVPNQTYRAVIWNYPYLFLQQDAVSAGWVHSQWIGVSLEGADCYNFPELDSGDLLVYADFCFFVSESQEPIPMFEDPELSSLYPFEVYEGNVFIVKSRSETSLEITLSDSGPAGYIDPTGGYLLGACEDVPGH